MSHKAKTSALKNLHVEDVVPPEKIIENFVDLYEKEWYHAFEILKASWRDEEKAMFSLFRIVKVRDISKINTLKLKFLLQQTSKCLVCLIVV